MSQRELCEATNHEVSATAIAKYEKGEMFPSSSVLVMLSKALEMNIDYFFRPFTITIDTSKFEFRKSTNLKAKKIESVKYTVCTEIEKYVEIESILGINTIFSLNYNNICINTEDDAIKLALKVREDLKIGNDAIVSAIELLESHGIKIIEIEHDDNFSGTCNTAGTIPIIVINKNLTTERKRITIFHELGHLLMHCAKGIDVEKMCTIFASEMLIPSEKIKSILGAVRHDISLIELQSIQREYGISIDDLMLKATQIHIITNRRYSTYQKKKNLFPALKNTIETSLCPTEHTNRFERLVYRALASEMITYSKAASLLNVSINDVRNTLNLM